MKEERERNFKTDKTSKAHFYSNFEVANVYSKKINTNHSKNNTDILDISLCDKKNNTNHSKNNTNI